MKQLSSILFEGFTKTLNDSSRNSSLDVWRGFAILAVVLSHYNGNLFYGRVAVDLFFTLSGILIGQILMRQYYSEEGVKFWHFFIRRGFKIWPSYLLFCVLTLLLSKQFIEPHYPEEHLPFADSLKYFLFYINYDFMPNRHFFAHTWSLSVEEHFYFILPILLIVFKWFKLKHKQIVWALIAVIILGIGFKIHNWFYFHTDHWYLYYTATHNRIDGLAYGTLFAVLLVNNPNQLKSFKYKTALFFIGAGLMLLTLAFHLVFAFEWFRVICFHALTSLSIVIMIAAWYHSDFKSYTVFRAMGYYSYNWYIWHMWVYFFFTPYEKNTLNMLLYLIITFVVGFGFSLVVEEPFLRLRKRLMS